jgi:tetratricopeptide (TPR) repeat protein
MDEQPQKLSPLPATPFPHQQDYSFANSSGPLPPSGPVLAPNYRSDALLDSDLETTMKRPAVKLQPMQPAPSQNQGQSDRTYGNGNGKGRSTHSNDRKAPEPVEGNVGSHERLVKGYQYQLAGAYEESMQEYRQLIRNAPELVDDVISNMRAMLKLNPRLSAGYRVLGDAYMRKGEYLQAMESYNKALTMAKKAHN